MKKIVFVCTGNTCRSPMAKHLLLDLADKEGRRNDFACDSAGIAAQSGDPASENAVRALEELGIDSIKKHRAKRLDEELIRWADELYVMSPSHRMLISQLYPDCAAHVNILGAGVPDPYGQDLQAYRSCRDYLKEYIEKHIL
ncbi:MAG: low molecular weight protein arginine phosphatase [Oscillospiraceae bacterium]